MTQKFNKKAMAFALGTMWSLAVLFISIVALTSNTYLHNVADFLATFYLGYSLNFSGILIGMIWAFFDAAIGGYIFAWLYNKFS